MNKLAGTLLTLQVVAGFVATLHPQVAISQEPPTESTAGIEEVTVTATKRETRLQETPIAITALSARDLEQGGAFDAVDIGKASPGLYAAHLSDFGSPVFFIRGVGTDSFSVGSDQSVGVYLDGVYIGRNVASIVSLLDLERIEVLKGPQGTLYGRNTTGGAINYISRKPSREPRSEFHAALGNFDSRSVSGVLSGPLVGDVLQGKIGYEHNERDGYIHNRFDGTFGSDRTSDAAIAQIFWQPTDSFDVLLHADWGQDDTAGTYGSNLTPSFDPFGIFGSPQPFPAFPATRLGADVDCAKSTGCGETRKRTGATLALDWRANDTFNFKSTTAYRDYDYFIFADQDGTSLPLDLLYGHERQHQFSQELQAGVKRGPLDLIFGAFYFREVAAWPDVFFGVAPFDFFVIASNETNAYATYADVKYQVTDRLTLAGGLRYSKDKKEITYGCEDNIGLSAITCPLGSGRVLGVKNKESWADTTPQFTVDFKWTERLMTYAKFSKGFKSGAFNSGSTDLPQPVDPETLRAYEIGAKSSWLDRRLILNVAAYTYDFEGLQLTTTDPTTGQSLTVSAGKARNRGGEIESYFQATPDLKLTVGLAYLDAKFTSFDTVSGDFTGNRLPRAPKTTALVSFDYSHPVNNDWSVFAYAGWSYSDKVYFDRANTPERVQKAYEIVDARLGLKNSQWTLAVSGRNLLDEAYYVGLGYSVAGNLVGTVAPPRMVSLDASWRFGAR